MNIFKALKRKSIKVLSVIAALFFLTVPIGAVQAQGGVELSTTYPGISAAAGETVTFPLRIKNTSTASQIVELETVAAPEGWDHSFKGNGREIQQVYVAGNDYQNTELNLIIPQDAKPGKYSTKIRVKGSIGQDELQLTLTIGQKAKSSDTLSAQYSELKGPSDATFNFKLNLTNNSGNEEIYSLGAEAPEGWQVSFKPSYEDQQVASINVKAGETKGLDVTVTPAASVEAGEFTIPIQATSSSGSVTEKISVIISGSYKMNFSTTSERLNADIVTGKEQNIDLYVKNTGSAVLNNINFSSQAPQGWSVKFSPDTIDALKPGEKRQVSATITADGKAISGDYVVSLSAATKETMERADIRTTVKTSTLWGLVALVIVLIVIAGVYWTFRTYGRR